MRLFGNLYAYLWSGEGTNCNTYLLAGILRGERPHVLIDPGFVTNERGERCFDFLLQALLRDGINPEEIGLIINTHCHPDHCEANAKLVELTKKKRGKGKAESALLAISIYEAEFLRGEGKKIFQDQRKEIDFVPDFFLQEGSLSLGKEVKIHLEIIHTPGHSPGSISLYWPEAKALFCGDTILYRDIGAFNLPGADRKLFRHSIERLSELDVELLLPGHSTRYGNIIVGRERIRDNFSAIRAHFFPSLL